MIALQVLNGVNMSHGHNCNATCDHSHDDPAGDTMGIAYSLYSKINLEGVECLNEAVDGSGKTIFKPWNERLDNEHVIYSSASMCLSFSNSVRCAQYIESDADEELLINIPFTGNVKLKGIIVRGADDDSHPSKMRL